MITSIKDLSISASKAMFSLLKRARNVNLPLDTLIAAFDVMVTPILLYGCEIWGYENIEILEQVHLKFLKLCSGLKKSTPNFMVYGELGRYPLALQIKKRMISFWYKTLTENRTITLSICLQYFTI
jgi:hypothetical protein